MSLLQTTLSILCLMNPQAPSNESILQYLTSHIIEANINESNENSFKSKPELLFNYTDNIIDNEKLKVDFDSSEHLPTEIKECFINNPHLEKQLLIAFYIAEKNTNIEPNTEPLSVWTISTDEENNKQQIVLNVLFDSLKQLLNWLLNLTTQPSQEIFNVITMGFIKLPFRCYYYLDYNKEPRHHRFKHMLQEEAQQCDALIANIISPTTKNNRREWLNHLTYALKQIQHDGLFLEFGVWKGETITHIANTTPEKTIHGFDSFEGLQEEWNKSPVGLFNLNGELPVVPSNVILHKGFFKDSLPPFRESLPETIKTIAFMHVDCDLYQSTKDIFKVFGDMIIPGTIIAFDDFLYNANWILHEPLAFTEFLKERTDLTFEYITYTGAHQVVVRMLEKKI